MTNLEQLVETFLATFEEDPQGAEKAITSGLMTLSEGDDDMYLALRSKASSLVMAALERTLREEVAEANQAAEVEDEVKAEAVEVADAE